MRQINISFRIMGEGRIRSASGTQGGFKCAGFVSWAASGYTVIIYIFCA